MQEIINNDADTKSPAIWLFVATAFFLISLSFLIASRRNGVDIDLFHEMCLARQFAEDGTFPQTDAFAYTPTVERVVHHEWGTGAIAYAVIEQLGMKSVGLMALKYLLILLIGMFCFIAARLRGATWPLIVPCFALATIIGGQIGYTTIRAQLFTMVFLAIEFCLLALDRNGKRWWIPVWLVLVVVWANVHAGIVAGLGIFCFYVAFKLIQPWRDPSSTKDKPTGFVQNLKSNQYLAWVALLSFGLLLVNPYGIHYPFYLYYGTTLDRPLINEWKPLLSVINDVGFLTLLGSSAVLAIIGFKSSWRTRPFEVFVILLTAYLALKHVRHLSIYAVTWACIVPGSLAQGSFGQELTKIGTRLAKPIVVVAAIGGMFLGFQAVQAKFWKMQVPAFFEDAEPTGMLYPVGAVQHLEKSKFHGNLMVPFSVGAFVSWNLYPDVKVSIDSRYEVAYPPGAIEESFDFYDAKGDWKKTLAKYETDLVLVPNFKPIKRGIDSMVEWSLVYSDPMYSLFSNQKMKREPTVTDQTQFNWEF